MKTSSLLVLGALTLVSEVTFCQESKKYYEDKKRGWFWREIREESKDEKSELKEGVESSLVPETQTPAQIIESIKKEFEDARDAAIVDPSEENIVRYMKANKEAWNRSERFGEAFGKALYRNPELNPSTNNPVDSVSLGIANRENRKDRERKISEISQKYGLLYFFKGTCSFCQNFSPTLKKFSVSSGFSVTSFTLDGNLLPGYENSHFGVDLATQLKVTSVPAVYIVNPETGAIGPVSFGSVSEDELIKRIIASEETVSESRKSE